MSVLYITEQGSYLRKSGGRFVVTHKDEELASIPETALERVMIFGACQVSSQAIGQLLEHGVDLVYMSRGGKFRGILSSGCSKNVFLRMAQYERSLDDDFSLSSARNVVLAKCESCNRTVRRWQRSGWLASDIPRQLSSSMHSQIEACHSHSELLGCEANIARGYFKCFALALPPPFEWAGRNRRPPRDPVNALLSLTYMLVLGGVISECNGRGLDPHIGYLHRLDYGRPSLALDILEPLRAEYCDHFVLHCLQSELMELSDFHYSERDGCRLAPDAFKRFIQRYDQYRKNGITRSVSLNRRIRDLTGRVASGVRGEVACSFSETPPETPWMEENE